MALTVLLALGGSLILSMTLMPALAAIALPRNPSKEDVLLLRLIKRLYRPLVSIAIAQPLATALVGLAIVGVSIPIARNLGGDFMPQLEEGDILVEASRLPSASLEGAVELSKQIEQQLITLPEVKTVFCKTGRPEIANDVMAYTRPMCGSF